MAVEAVTARREHSKHCPAHAGGTHIPELCDDASTDAAISGRSRIRTGAKGVAGEREVADIFQTAGFDVRGLESSGDWLVVQKDGRVIHVEVKRHERPQWGEWVKQAERDCPQGVPLMVANRRNRQPWYVMQRLEYVVEREARIAELEERYVN